jgi:hypothetical protein
MLRTLLSARILAGALAGAAAARALDAGLYAAFGKIPVSSCVFIAIPPGIQTIAFHNPSSFKERSAFSESLCHPQNICLLRAYIDL